jgi:hypothetical protein
VIRPCSLRKSVTPRISSLLPSARVPVQCHSVQAVSSCSAVSSSSAWKSGIPAKSDDQFFSTWSRPPKPRSGWSGCSLRYSGVHAGEERLQIVAVHGALESIEDFARARGRVGAHGGESIDPGVHLLRWMLDADPGLGELYLGRVTDRW